MTLPVQKEERGTIVVDVESHYARACAAALSLMSGGAIRRRLTWLIRPGEPVWRWEP